MTRRLVGLAVALAMALAAPAFAADATQSPANTVAAMANAPAPIEPSFPTRWDVQIFVGHAPDLSFGPYSKSADAQAKMVEACGALAGELGMTAAEKGKVRTAVAAIRLKDLSWPADATGFPCDLALDAAGGRLSYVRIVAQRAR